MCSFTFGPHDNELKDTYNALKSGIAALDRDLKVTITSKE